MSEEQATATDQADELVNTRHALLDLTAQTIDNMSAIAGLSHGETVQVCFNVALNAALNGFSGDRKAALAFIEEYSENILRKLRHEEACQLVLPPGVSRQ